jgi:hypothetical protein
VAGAVGLSLWNSSACRDADNKKDQANDEKEKEKKLGNSRRRHGYAGKSKQRRDQCDYQKDYSPTQHTSPPANKSRQHLVARVFVAIAA